MFEIYLNNLYRNLNLYNIQNPEKYTNFYKNKIKNMIGGNDINLEKLTKLKELSQKLKSDIDEIKNKPRSTSENTVTIDKKKFEAMTALIKFSVEQIARDHELVKQSIDRMNTTIDSNEFKSIQETINEINSMFADLLS
jgi:hypothetical protein